MKKAKKSVDEVKDLKIFAGLVSDLKRIENSGIREFAEYLSSPTRVICMNFLAGTFRGLGFFIGASLVLAIFAFVVTKLLSGVPIVGEFFSALLRFLQQNAQFGSGINPGL